MMNDEIDLEELESRLYSQVYHSRVEDYEDETSLPNTTEKESFKPRHPRYFQAEVATRPHFNNAEYIPLNSSKDARNFTQSTSKARAADFFKCHSNNTRDVSDVPINSSAAQQIVHMVNPCNNILLLPSDSTQIISHGDYIPTIVSGHSSSNLDKYIEREVRREEVRRKKLQRNKKRRKEKRKMMMKDMQEVLEIETENFSCKEDNKDNFKVHYLSSNNVTPEKLDYKQKVVVISDDSDSSDDSCIEIPEKRELVVLSSDDSDSETKCEINSKVKIEKCIKEELKTIDADKNYKPDEDDDDVLLIDDIPKDLEIIDIDCDAKSVTNAESNKHSSEKSIETSSTCSELRKLNNSSDKIAPTIKQKALVNSKERLELLRTPDSASNDFLDNAIDLQQKKFNFGLHGTDFGSSSHNFLKPRPATSETESTCSTSETATPVKLTVFNEVEFETPNKELFDENDLESFGEYITPTRDDRPSNSSANADFEQTLAKVNKRIRDRKARNESDSSSESDFEMERPPGKVRKTLPDLTSLNSSLDDKIESNRDTNENTNKRKKGTDPESSIPKKKIRDSCENTAVPNNSTKSDALSGSVTILETRSLDVEPETTNDDVCEIITPVKQLEAEVFYIEDSSSPKSRFDVESIDNDLQLVNCETPTRPPKKDGDGPAIYSGFAKYWTTDMHKFHNTSWGLEDFDVREIQKTMSDDAKLWKIVNEDRGSMRHYTPKGPRCHRCREKGHISINCRNDQRPLVCILCGQMGHAEPRCPNSSCTSCGWGRSYRTYCNFCTKWRHKQCKTCYMHGHRESNCPDIWRRYHLTTEPGPIVKPFTPTNKIPQDRWCSGCSRSGHYEYKCRTFQRDHCAVNPFVKEYTDVYDFPKTQPFLIHCDFTNSTQPSNSSRNTDRTSESTNGRNADRAPNVDHFEEIVGNSLRDNKSNEQRSNTINTANFLGSNYEKSFDDCIFPPIEMIPSYFRDQIAYRRTEFEDNTTESDNSRNNSTIRDYNIETPSESTDVIPIQSSSQNTTSKTINLNKDKFAYAHATRGTNFLNQIRVEFPNISLTIEKIDVADENWGPRGKLTIQGGSKSVREAVYRLNEFFRNIPKGTEIPTTSKAAYNVLLGKLKNVDKIVGNCKNIYADLLKLLNGVGTSKNFMQTRSAIKETRIHLNMLLFGRLELADGKKHMDHLRHCLKEFEIKDNYKIPLRDWYEIVDSYSYIFLDMFNHDYQSLCATQPNIYISSDNDNSSNYNQRRMKRVCRVSRVIENKCKKFNMPDKLKEMKSLKDAVRRSPSTKNYKEFSMFSRKLFKYFNTIGV